ncbi:nuclease A inhibitor family protein [Calothrix sp. PCC 7507]|uniref:nuclease A inhibitor family protein n=1 Tax=Calothrix sp. PCC 7507 TaxID=99598 RepID=UPI00029EF5A1|nr:Nuclease A inhibitor family protein [Calothrix sp. PCC 7507]
MNNTEILDQLKQASDGLLFQSESEYPFEVLLWEHPDNIPLTPTKVLEQTGHSAGTPVKAVAVDDFFKVAVTGEDWHGEEERQTVNRFQTLVQTLKENLSDLQVYRLGETEQDVYVIGQTPSGDSAGLATKAVET